MVLSQFFFFFLMIRRPPRSTQGVSSAASDVYKRQVSTQSTWDYQMQRKTKQTEARAAAQAGQKKQFETSISSGGKPIYSPKKKRGDLFPFYNEEAEGLQLGPKTVVVLGLLFMGVVVILHIFSKLRSQASFLSLIHISEPTRPLYISYAVFCLKKKKKKT
eukprot:TRINITY_DN6131_c0_g1_i7.p1 TRINITY_DN6131_c0_g1~~TRINITY_DN6131_c0_g1_i7.p1  ORF type:complete len:161 (-),score=46.51 TRINITY_DN6131_c0_g1_i7:63-545(-)